MIYALLFKAVGSFSKWPKKWLNLNSVEIFFLAGSGSGCDLGPVTYRSSKMCSRQDKRSGKKPETFSELGEKNFEKIFSAVSTRNFCAQIFTSENAQKCHFSAFLPKKWHFLAFLPKNGIFCFFWKYLEKIFIFDSKVSSGGFRMFFNL